MFLLRWSGSDLLLMVAGALVVVSTVMLVVPAADRGSRSHYSDAEIGAYDGHLPRYYLFAAVALVVGGVHMVIKNIPWFSTWLWEAGYGGHLFRDLSNSHIIIVGGGTVMLTGLTWYLLPRMLGRPLFSEGLATASLWFTVIGVFGFYLAWLVLGLVEGSLVRGGMDYDAAKELVGAWHTVPTRLTSTVMGIGYWTYVLDVALTVWAGRRVVSPHRRLVKFLAVPAAALFVGTVQGVLQVLPDNADWIHKAGEFGEYVDPISHAHINLVTGMVVALAGLLAFTWSDLGGRRPESRWIAAVFWTLTVGSIGFYLVFLFSGLILGGQVVGHGGIQAPGVAAWLGPRFGMFIAIAGALMLAGFWMYFWFVGRVTQIGDRLREALGGAPIGFWLLSLVTLALGTLHGLAQAVPITARYLTAAEELPNVHAQLNMIGGVLPALMATGIVLIPKVTGVVFPRRAAKRTLYGIGVGIIGYYVATLWEGTVRGGYLLSGMPDGEAAAAVGALPSLAMFAAGVMVLFGFLSFANGTWATTVGYRAEWRGRYRSTSTRVTGPMPDRLGRTPTAAVVALEFVAALFGWPGAGWLFAGKAIPGVALLLAGPAVAWALLPMLFSPFTGTALSSAGWPILLAWLPVTATLSAGMLAIHLAVAKRRSRVGQSAEPQRVEMAS